MSPEQRLIDAVRNAIDKTSSPGMQDPFRDSWKWRYSLQDALLSCSKSLTEEPKECSCSVDVNDFGECYSCGKKKQPKENKVEKVWCVHMEELLMKLTRGDSTFIPTMITLFGEPIIHFCPTCGKPRPIDMSKEDRLAEFLSKEKYFNLDAHDLSSRIMEWIEKNKQ